MIIESQAEETVIREALKVYEEAAVNLACTVVLIRVGMADGSLELEVVRKKSMDAKRGLFEVLSLDFQEDLD